ncbi:hypothetical protein CASFOL_039715 [Castilleja foliolosa]|uniref:Uncharacterized protein n=1 Tax=Castilleja foliolosa TaxID=1961234 RepID=A0ABD3BG00_9LAMI
MILKSVVEFIEFSSYYTTQEVDFWALHELTNYVVCRNSVEDIEQRDTHHHPLLPNSRS